MLARVIDNDLTTDDFTLFMVIISAILIGIAIYYRGDDPAGRCTSTAACVAGTPAMQVSLR